MKLGIDKTPKNNNDKSNDGDFKIFFHDVNFND
jgi:hypothetical protein